LGKEDTRQLVLVLDERSGDLGRALDDLEPQFTIKRVVSVIGCNVQEAALAAVVMHLHAPETRAPTLINLLRGQRGLDSAPVILLVPSPTHAVERAVQGLPGVEVLDLSRAYLQLRPRISSAFPTPVRRSQPNLAPASGTPHERLQKRFLVHSAERGQRALALCDELKRSQLSAARRTALLEEVKDLLNMMKGEATMLRLRSVAEVLTTAETIVSRIDSSPTTLAMPMGVLGLFSDLASLNASGASIGAFDADLHRNRLISDEASVPSRSF
jgi:hypothetical protein